MRCDLLKYVSCFTAKFILQEWRKKHCRGSNLTIDKRKKEKNDKKKNIKKEKTGGLPTEKQKRSSGAIIS